MLLIYRNLKRNYEHLFWDGKNINIGIPVSTFVTHDKSSHRLISWTCLQLIVRTISQATLAAFQVGGFGSLNYSQSGCINTLLDICLALFLHLVRGHFLRFHYGNSLWSNYSAKYIFTQLCVLFVPQVEDSRSNCVFVSGICWFVVEENCFFNQLCQFFWWFYCTVREITSTWNV